MKFSLWIPDMEYSLSSSLFSKHEFLFREQAILIYMLTFNIYAYFLYMPILQIGFSLLFFKQVGS